jgi:hypothetical protein
MEHKANLELHIEQITLHGFAAKDRRGIGEAVQQELTRLLEEEGIPDGLRTPNRIPSLHAPEIRLESTTSADAIGGQIARSLYAAWTTVGE